MSPWKLEALRLWRTRRLIAVAATFVILGLGLPVLTKELPALVNHSSGGIRVIALPPTATQAISGFASNAGQLGTLVIVVVAAAGLAIDARPSLAAFYRSRVRRPVMLMLPRCAALATASIVCLALGVGCAWYETDVVLGALPAGRLASGFALQALWLCSCVATVAAWASVARGVLAVAGMTLVSLLVLVFLTDIPALVTWSPTNLAAGVGVLIGNQHRPLWHAVAVAAVATVALIGVSIQRLAHRTT